MPVKSIFERKGAPVLIHREGDTVPCPCRTPEGYRDPEWHKAHPDAPVCNANGFLVNPIDLTVKAFMQPAQNGRRGMSSITELFGQIQTDDYLGMFPLSAGAITLYFDNWTTSGAEYIAYNGMRFIVVGWSLIPDPHDSGKNHHWELALRRINADTFGPSTGY